MKTVRTSRLNGRRPLVGEILESRRMLSIDMPDLEAYEMQRWVDHVVSLPPAEFSRIVESGNESSVVVPDVIPTPAPEPLIEFSPPSIPRQESIWAEVIPRFVDGGQRPIESIKVGETAWVEIVIDDTRKFSQRGVFSAFFDINFGDARVELAGEAVFSHQYQFLRRSPSHVGWNGIGAVDTKWFTPDPDPHRLVRIPVKFGSVGDATIQLSPHHGHNETLLLYGYDHEVSEDRIDFGKMTINVLPHANDAPVKFQSTSETEPSTKTEASGFVSATATNDPPIELTIPGEEGLVLTVAIEEPLGPADVVLGNTPPRAFVVSQSKTVDDSEEESRSALRVLEFQSELTL